MDTFEVPVVLFLYKRLDTVLAIIDRLRMVKVTKVYLISDAGKNESDTILIENHRKIIEDAIDWECIIIKNFAESNRGVYENIGLGAKWVFEREPMAIFLEDDNLPELTFFDYCRELLYKYQEDTRILWICGTNYLGMYEPEDGSSYMFTKHLLPCGWASWSDKFLTFYEFDFKKLSQANIKKVKFSYDNKKLFFQQLKNWKSELLNENSGQKYHSWDYHMSWSIRVNSLWGISPKYNQIMNIGVDSFSEHGGTSFDNVMTQRFCGMNSYPLPIGLKHPESLLPDINYEKKIGNIILYPLNLRIMGIISKFVRFIFSIPYSISIKQYFIKVFRGC